MLRKRSQRLHKAKRLHELNPLDATIAVREKERKVKSASFKPVGQPRKTLLKILPISDKIIKH